MQCEEIVISLIIVALLLIIMSNFCTRSLKNDSGAWSNEISAGCPDFFADFKRGVPIDSLSVVNHAKDNGVMPVSNSMTSVRRYQSESAVDPDEVFDSQKESDFIDLYMVKKKSTRSAFTPGLLKNNTAVRHKHD